jgi:hypothetical protein
MDKGNFRDFNFREYPAWKMLHENAKVEKSARSKARVCFLYIPNIRSTLSGPKKDISELVQTYINSAKLIGSTIYYLYVFFIIMVSL